jgi:hypothetical protein
MHHLWVAELWEENLCLCVSHIDLLHIFFKLCSYLKFNLTLDLNS